MLPGEMGHLAFPRDEVAYFVPTKRLHSVEWARAASGSRKAVCCGYDKAVGSWNILFQDPTV